MPWRPKPVVANLSKLQSQSTSNATSIVQKAAIAALAGSQECVAEFRAEFIDLRDYMLAGLAKIPGITCTKPEGAFYVYPNIGAFLGKGGIKTATELATRLLHEAHVVTVPGEAFGTAQHIRISYPVTRQNIDEGTRRMGEYPDRARIAAVIHAIPRTALRSRSRLNPVCGARKSRSRDSVRKKCCAIPVQTWCPSSRMGFPCRAQSIFVP